MYLRILKKDLKRKKTMNLILLIFITLAAAFIASGAGNMLSVATALDHYFELAEAPDYWFATLGKSANERFEQFASEHSYRFRRLELIQLEPRKITVDGEFFDYSNT
ncbi:MAG: ABC transporter permease, partial [Lachnospiraceae bacterium]|nr:ABC transporter permease [Lachnospiraceae bacterium]